MQVRYVIRDERGNVGQNIQLVAGESRKLSVYLYKDDGTPFLYTGTIAEILLKIYSNINQASIVKRYTVSSAVVPITLAGDGAGMIGFTFSLLPADTAQMAANNSGLPMTAVITDNATPANVLELDFPSVFTNIPPLIQT